jgi:flagellar hook-basal body complex protein FliE
VSILSQPRLTVDLTLTDIAQEDDLLERDYQKLDEEEEQIQVPSPKFGPRRARPETPDSIEHTISLRDLDEELRAELKTVLQNAQQEASDLEANPPLEDLETFPELAEFTHTTIQLQRQLASQHAEAAALRDRCAQLHANMAACMKAPAVLQQALQTALTERDEARQQLSVVASDLEEVKSAAITALSQSKGGKLRVDNSSNSNVPSVSATTTLSPTAGPVNADLAPVPAAIALQAPRVLSHRQALITPRGDSRPQTPRITRATTSAVTAAAPSFGRRASISVSLDGAVAVNVQHKRNAEHVQTQTDEDDEIVQLRDKVDELQSALRQQGMDLHEAHAQLSAAASEAVELELLLAATRQQQSEALVVQQRLVMAKFGLQKKLVTELRAVCQVRTLSFSMLVLQSHQT